MYIPIFSNDRYSNSYRSFVADKESDVPKIKVALNGTNMGSEVYVIETSKTYVLGSDNVWYSRGAGDDSKIECDCIEESTIWEDLPNPTE